MIFGILYPTSNTILYPIEFFNLKFHKATVLTPSSTIKLHGEVFLETKRFQIVYDQNVFVEGYYNIDTSHFDYKKYMVSQPSENAIKLNKKDVYKELKIRGYDYKGSFQGIEEAMSDGTYGVIKYHDDWISFSDSCLQMAILDHKSGLYIPTSIEYIRCDYVETDKAVEEARKASESNEAKLEMYYNKITNIGVTSGILIKGLKATAIQRRQNVQIPTLEALRFRPYNETIHFDRKKKEKLDDYLFHCQQCLNIIKGKSNIELDLNVIKNYTEINNSQFSLLSTLNHIVSKRMDEKNNIVKESSELIKDLATALISNQAELSKDMTFKLPIQALITSQLRIMLENILKKNINLIEMNLSMSPLYDEILHYTHKLTIRCKPTLMVPDKNLPIFDSYKVDKMELDLTKGVSKESQNGDLVIFKDPRSTFYSDLEYINEFNLEEILRTCRNSLNDNGQALIFLRTKLTKIENEINCLIKAEPCQFFDLDELKSLLKKFNLELVGEKQTEDQSWTSLVIKKAIDLNDIKKHMKIMPIDGQCFDWIDELKKNIADDKLKQIWLTTKKSSINGILGMVQCLKKEPKGNKIRCLFDFDRNDNLTIDDEIIKKNMVLNVMSQNQHGCLVGEFLSDDEDQIKAKHIYLDVKTKGDLSSFRWFEALHNKWTDDSFKILKKKVVGISIYYSALNFRDIMLASGRISKDGYPEDLQLSNSCIGIEYSGRDQNGQRVMGFCESQAISTSLYLDERSIFLKVPDTMTLEEAATIPVCYYTAYYALMIRGKLKRGEKILIHAGSGGVGQAAISICLKRHCEVFTTVSTQVKRDFLKSKFPQLTDDHISNSRTTEFEEHVLKMTNGMGVDLVLNSLAEDKLQASLRCLAPYGRFLDVGKYDIMQNHELGN